MKKQIKKAIAKYPNYSDEFWKSIRKLRLNGTPELFVTYSKLLKSKDNVKRDIAVLILSQFNIKNKTRPYYKEVNLLFFDLLKKEKSVKIIDSLLHGIGHNHEYQKSEEEIDFLCSFANHNSWKVREATTYAIMTIRSDKTINCLRRLCYDKDPIVREWATFSLQTIEDFREDIITPLLLDKLNDDNVDVRMEAIEGLTNRKNKKVKKAIIKEIRDRNISDKLLNSIKEWSDQMLNNEIKKQLKKIKKLIRKYQNSPI